MQRDHVSLEPQATVEQIAEIKVLKEEISKLNFKLCMPIATFISILLPYGFNYLIFPGGVLHSYYTQLLLYLRIIKPELHFPHIESLNLVSHLQKEGLRTRDLTPHQSVIVGILNNFYVGCVSNSFAAKILTGRGFNLEKWTIPQLLDIEALAIEQRHLLLFHVKPPLNLTIQFDDLQKSLEKNKLIDFLGYIAHPAWNLVIPEDLFHKTMIAPVNKIGFMNVIAHPKLQKENFYQIVEWLKMSYQELIKEFKLGDDKNYRSGFDVFGKARASILTISHFPWIVIGLSALNNRLIIQPIIHHCYQKMEALISINSNPPLYLSRNEARQTLIKLKKIKNKKESLNSIIFILFVVFFLSGFLWALFDYQFDKRISSQLFTGGLGAIGGLVGALGGTIYQSYQHKKFIRKINKNSLFLNSAVQEIDQFFAPHVGENFKESWFEFKSQKHKNIPAALINRLVIDLFKKHGETIISNGKLSHTIAASIILNAEKSQEIKTEIKINMDRHIKIKKLKEKIYRHFFGNDILEIRKKDKENLPTVEFFIDIVEFKKFDLSQIKTLFFDYCVKKNEDRIIISLQPVSLKSSTRKKVKVELKTSETKTSTSHANHFFQKSDKKKTQSNIANLNQFVEEKKADIITWSPEYVYRSNQQGDIRPINHPLFSTTHFVTDALTPNQFPTPALYEAAKKKSAEAHLITSRNNKEGLQFYTGSEDYSLRLKLLGHNGKGDIAVYATKLVTNHNGKNRYLHILNPVELDRHSPHALSTRNNRSYKY